MVSDFDKNRLSSYILKTGDIVFSRVGSVDRNSLISELENGWLFSSRLLRIRINIQNISPAYLSYHFLQESTKHRIRSVAVGQTMASLNTTILKGIDISLPPLAEQKAIAHALSDVDNLITAIDQLITKKRNIKQGTMQELLTGKKRLPGFSGKWEVKKLGECLTKNPEYGINAPAVAYSDNLPVYIRITDISQDGRFLPDKKVSVNHILSTNYLLEIDDLVLARTGASTGKSYLYNTEDGELTFAGFLIRVKVNIQKLNPQYLKGFLNTKPYWNWVNMMSMRSGQPGINGKEYSQLQIPLPPLPEQKAIAEILTDMDKEIEALEKKRDKYKALKQGMMQELLTGKTRIIDN
jgi:type I restriction enzyme S subunit